MKINCHCHIFSLDCVPLEFRKRFFLNVKNPMHRFVHKVLRRILPKDSAYLKWFLEYSKKIPWCRVEFTEQEIKRLTEDNPKEFLGLMEGV